MPRLFGLLAAALLLACVSSLFIQPRETVSEPAAPTLPVSGEIVDTPADLESPLPGLSPSQLLFSIGGSGAASGPELMQGMGPLPEGWKPEPALDLSGAVPADDQIRAAITRAVDFLMEQQQENGAWDVELTGTLMSATADDAVDAIASTSLCGIALRYHVKVDPERIEPALRKAANFVIDRIYRGKLSLKVYYSIWRYALGMKFLHMEYMATQDAEYKAEISAISRRMVQSLLRLQMSNSAAATLERKQRTRLSSRAAKTAMPTQLGVVMDLPTDQAYRGGAPVAKVLPGSVAEKAGLKAGDKIIAAEGLRVENAVDYYTYEAEWVGGQKINIKVKREGGADFSRDITLEQTWPGYLGLNMNTGTGEGPVVESFLRFSPAKEKLEIGDVITKMDRVEIKSKEDFNKINDAIKPGDKVRIEVSRSGRRKSETIAAVAAPEGWHGYYPEIEDKGDESGVVVRGTPQQGSSAEKLGLMAGDRITWIGETPICGLDHWVDFMGTLPAGRNLMLKWMRGSEEMTGEAIADAFVTRGDPQFELHWDSWEGWFGDPKVVKIKVGGVSERAGVRNNDVIIEIDGQPVQYRIEAAIAFSQIAAGDDVTLKVKRGSQDKEFKFTLAKFPETAEEEVEEGGWAYYPDQGESPTFCTAFAMLALQNVQTDILPGLQRHLRAPIRSAQKLLHSLRVKDPTAGGQECYVYAASSLKASLPPDNDKRGVNMRGTQGRNTICELALTVTRSGGRGKSDIKRACENFAEYRSELDAVRRMEYYATNKGGSPHNFDRWWNAAYYWHFGHYHTLVGAKLVGGATQKKINEICTKAIMKTRLEDGTWLDHASFGKLVGTSLALWILGETEGGWKDGYAAKTTQEKMGPKEGEEEPDQQ